MDTLSIILWAYSALFVTLSFIHLIRLDYWWIRIWDFPHLQLFVLSLVGLLGWGLISRDLSWPMGLIPLGLAASLLYQGWLIYPYTAFHRRQVTRLSRRTNRDKAKTNTIRLLTANVYMENTHTPDVQKLIDRYDPDVVLLSEPNAAWQRGLKTIESRYPYRVSCPLENTYGMLFYSRFPIQNEQIRFLIKDDIPSMYAQLTLPSGQHVHFFGVHPMPPSPTEHYRSTERDAELLLVGKECRALNGPIIVAGDLNDVAWSHTTRLFQRISGLLDPRIGRGLYSTFHAKYFFLRWPLDHVFVSHHFQLAQLRRLPNCGSDHFPILVSLVYNPSLKRRKNIPQPEGDDKAETDEIIERATEGES